MKECAYCGKENEEAAVCCAECGTQEFKCARAEVQSLPKRRPRTIFTLILNFLFASIAALMAANTIRYADRELQLEGIIYLIVAPFWFLGATGLFFRNHLAWFASILGASTMLCGSIAMIGWSIVMSPVAQDPTDGIGYSMIIGVVGMFFSLPLVIALFVYREHLRNSPKA
jgi:hypothetical protein